MGVRCAAAECDVRWAHRLGTGADMSLIEDELAARSPSPAPAQRRAFRAPSMPAQLLEQRVLFEVGALAAAAPWLRAMGRGDRHPVLVLPGFMGDDASTVALRSFIRGWGYWA